jgi:hypothetical protein
MQTGCSQLATGSSTGAAGQPLADYRRTPERTVLHELFARHAQHLPDSHGAAHGGCGAPGRSRATEEPLSRDTLFAPCADDWGFEQLLVQLAWVKRLAHEGGAVDHDRPRRVIAIANVRLLLRDPSSSASAAAAMVSACRNSRSQSS